MFNCYVHNWYSLRDSCPECYKYITTVSDSSSNGEIDGGGIVIPDAKIISRVNPAILIDGLTLTVQEDKTAYGNRFYIQVEDSESNDNEDLRQFVGKTFKAKLVLEEE